MEPDNPEWAIVLMGLAIVLYGVCYSVEVALLVARKSLLQQWRDAGRRGAADALRLCEAPEYFQLTIRLVMTFAGVLAAVLGGVVAVQSVAPWLAARWATAGLDAWASVAALILIICALTYTTLVIGQLVPRSVGLQYPETVLCWLARPCLSLTRLCAACRWLLTGSLSVVLWLVRLQRPPESASLTAITEEAVTMMVREGAERGIFEEVEHELIEGVFEFTDTAAREVMVPRVHMQALEVDTPPQDVIHKMSLIGHSRVPVYQGDLDHIVGVLYFKDLLRAMSEGETWNLRSLLHRPLFVPETVQISQLLRTLQQRHLNMAIAIDEHGGVAGLVTIEDLLEQLVGEIGDEDEPLTDAQVVHLPDGAMVIQGSTPLWELQERYGLPVEESSDYQTIAGLLLARLGRIPQGGEAIVEHAYRFTVVDMEGPRIARVRVEPYIVEGSDEWAADVPLEDTG